MDLSVWRGAGEGRELGSWRIEKGGGLNGRWCSRGGTKRLKEKVANAEWIPAVRTRSQHPYPASCTQRGRNASVMATLLFT